MTNPLAADKQVIAALKNQLSDKLPPVTASTLYHYCSGSTLNAILQNKTIRACDVDKMNDYLEFKWGLEVLKDAIKLSEDETSEEFTSSIRDHVDQSLGKFVPVIACFSTDGDVLSQWRAYADDGEGFSIGFSTDALRSFPGNIYNVVYDRGQQLQLLRDHLKSEFKRWNKCKDNDKEDCAKYTALTIAADLCLFKNSAFAEEKEARLVYLLQSSSDDDGFDQLSDPAEGMNDGVSECVSLSHLLKGGLIVPYCDIKSTDPDENLINEVIIGPKNKSTERDLKRLLYHYGFDDARSLRSSASYR